MKKTTQPKKQSGQATVEYTIVLLGAVIILLANPDVICQIVKALKEVYDAFVYAISFSAIPL